jgi:hypothetical protein
MTAENSSKHLHWIEHGDKSIFFVDLNGLSAPDALKVLDGLAAELEGKAPNSVLSLVDLTGAGYDPSISSRWKAAHIAYASVVRGTALYGLSGIVGVATRAFVEVLRMMGLSRQEKLRIFSTREEALAWLGQL